MIVSTKMHNNDILCFAAQKLEIHSDMALPVSNIIGISVGLLLLLLLVPIAIFVFIWHR